ncbi:MAG TPA: TPM domain-containing protein [Nitrospira sp.]|nr:TPM domain-containing protein [Nitrospira sp.]
MHPLARYAHAAVGLILTVFTIAVAFLSASASFALDVPPLTGRVIDLAHVLPDSEILAISGLLEAHEERTGNQVAVLILPSLEGEPLEEFSHRVATTWKLGRKGIDNGVLLLVAVKERRIRIEVGYGLEGTLTDLRSAHIIREQIVPRFRAGDIPGGVRAGVNAILGSIEGTYQAPASDSRPRAEDLNGLHYVVIGVMVGFLAGLILSQGLGKTRALFGSVLAYLIAQTAAIFWGLVAALVTALLLWMVLKARPGRGRRTLDDWTWYSSRGGGWSGGFSDGGGFSGGGGDFGGGGASGDW